MGLRNSILLLAFLIPGIFCRGQGWEKFGKCPFPCTFALFTDTVDNLLYVGGSFNFFNGSSSDSITASSIATWNGMQWDTLGEGTNCINEECLPVYDIIRFKDKVFAGGIFSQMGNVNSSIAAWNGTDWEYVADPPNDYISGFNVIDDTLYIMGGFTEFEGLSVKGLVKYDGTNFSDVHGFGQLTFPNFSGVEDIELYNGELYVAGRFEGEGGKTHICRFDGSQWVDVGGGITPGPHYDVADLEVYKGELYACGEFERINGEDFGYSIARWDGAQWKDVGGGIKQIAPIYDMAIWRDKLVVLGIAAALPDARNICMWDGTKWCARDFSSDPDQWISASTNKVEVYQDTLYIGGGFSYFDEEDQPNNIIAKYMGDENWDTCGTYALGVGEFEGTTKQPISIFPNPTSDQLNIQVARGMGAIEITVLSIDGRVMLNRSCTGNETLHQIPVQDYPAGIYLLHLTSGEQVTTLRFVKEHL